MSEPSHTGARSLVEGAPTLPRKWPMFQRLLRLAKSNGAIALLDQAVVSGVNSITTLALARYLAKTHAGYYALIFAALIGINALQSALITSPLMVLAPRFNTERRTRYFNSLWVIQLAGCGPVSVATLVTIVGVYLWQPAIRAEVGVLQLLLVVVTYLGQEFARRMFFVRQQGRHGLGVDLISYGSQFVVIVVLIVQQRLTLSATIWTMGLTSLTACVFGVLHLRPAPKAVTRHDLAETWQQHWGHGRWLTGSAVAQWISQQGYLFVVGLVISVDATAVLHASRQLLGFLHIFLLGLENFVPALVTRRLVHGGVDAMVGWLRKFRVVLAAAVGTYCVVAAVFAEPLLRLLGEQYAGGGVVVAVLAVAYFIMPFTFTYVFALRAMDAPRWIFRARCAAAGITLVIAVPLVAIGGVIGAAFGLVVTYLTVFILVRASSIEIIRAARTSA